MHDRDRKRKRIAGEINQILFLAVFQYREIRVKQPIHAPSAGILHHHWNLHPVDRNPNRVEPLLRIDLISLFAGSRRGRGRLSSLILILRVLPRLTISGRWLVARERIGFCARARSRRRSGRKNRLGSRWLDRRRSVRDILRRLGARWRLGLRLAAGLGLQRGDGQSHHNRESQQHVSPGPLPSRISFHRCHSFLVSLANPPKSFLPVRCPNHSIWYIQRRRIRLPLTENRERVPECRSFLFLTNESYL